MQNPELKKAVLPENDLKNTLVEYVGDKMSPDDQNVTVEMIIDAMADEFPEFLMVVAQENFLRGYTTGLEDAKR